MIYGPMTIDIVSYSCKLVMAFPWLLFSFLGLLLVTKFCYSIIYWSYAFFLRPAKDLKSSYGSWALVTGSTDGIGKAVAFELARKNLNLVLVGRNHRKLDAVSDAIKHKFKNVEIKKVLIDLSKDLQGGTERLLEAIDGLDVGVLVNSAGITAKPMFLHEGEIELWGEMVRVNLEALTRITRTVLPGMLERRRGAIVNIGSASSMAPSFPLATVYASTKAYVDQLSKSLYGEYKNTGIDVQCQHGLFVNTRMVPKILRGKRYSLLVAPTEAYARATVRWIGYERACLPYFPHFVQWLALCSLPDFLFNWISLHTNSPSRKTLKFSSVRKN